MIENIRKFYLLTSHEIYPVPFLYSSINNPKINNNTSVWIIIATIQKDVFESIIKILSKKMNERFDMFALSQHQKNVYRNPM